jgi:ubiquinone biosynthesis protein UbiJ
MMIETIFNAGKMWHEETLKTLQLNIAEFLQEETRDLPANAEVEMFYNQVTKLECDVKKLEEKLNHTTGKST